MASDYISKSELLKKIDPDGERIDPIVARVVILQMPTADVQPVVHGTWIETPIGFQAKRGNKDIVKMFVCSNCKVPAFDCSGLKYCPNCGALMDGKDGEK